MAGYIPRRMGVADVLVEDDTFDVANDWVEAIENTQPGGGDVMSMQDAEAVIVVQTVPSKIRSMIRKVLGFSYSDPQNNESARLRRENPLRHPRYPWMRAMTIAFSQFPPGGFRSSGTIVAIKEPSATPVRGYPGQIQSFATYQAVYATVRFRSPRWVTLEDDQIATNADEIQRNVYWDVAGETSMISAEGPLGQCVWREGGSAGEPTPFPGLGYSIKQAFGTLVSKGIFTMTWKMVPHEWVCLTPYPLPVFTNILACVGRVNLSAFAGFPAGTLLCGEPRYSPFQWQISNKTGISGFYGWDISIPFKQFDPDKGVSSTKRGWRLLPWPQNGLWYWATRLGKLGDVTPPPFLPEQDFNIIFEKATT